MTNTELVIDGQCGGCRKKIRLRVPSPVAGQEISVKCPECSTPLRHVVTQKDLLEGHAREVVKAKVRAEVLAEMDREKDVKRQLEQYAIREDPHNQKIHEQTRPMARNTMTSEERTLLEKHSIKRLRALKDIDPRLGRPLGEKILKALRRGTIVDSGNKLIRGPHWNKIERVIPPTFSPSYQMGENRAKVIETRQVQRPWLVSANSEAYDIEYVPAQEFEIADEAPYFRAKELVQSGQAESVDGVQVSHAPTDNGFVQYHLWWQFGCWVGRNRDGKPQGDAWELVEWFGIAGYKGFPTQPCRLYLQPADWSPECACYDGEPAELYDRTGGLSIRRWFRIPRQRKRNAETPEAAQERLRKKWIDEQMAGNLLKA